MKALALAGVLASIAIVATITTRSAETPGIKESKAMELGNFSVSLTVKDIKASKAFYEKLDFKEVAGKLEDNWIVLQNGNARIGLFQGMFDKNVLTFNPGWSGPGEEADEFTDVRAIKDALVAAGVDIVEDNTGDEPEGPAHLSLVDPDGNPILIDQHR